jgi:hypothetical protein
MVQFLPLLGVRLEIPISNVKIPAYRQAGKYQINVKVQMPNAQNAKIDQIYYLI